MLKRLRKDRNVTPTPDTSYQFVAQAPEKLDTRPVVIGAGPCGLFAALILAQMGFRPIILERGKVVRERTKDTWGLWRKRVLNPESNVQFGEGGAGTFSDGKLYSQIKDPRHLGRKVLTEFVKAGAPRGDPDRSAAAYRHLPAGEDGGEACAHDDRGAGRRISASSSASTTRRSRRRTGARQVRGVRAERRAHSRPIMSCWRSATARATPSRCCTQRGVYMEAKPFSIGVRIEHPQSLIDTRALRRRRRQPDPRRGRLQAGAPRQERPHGLQLLHVSRRHGGRGGIGAGPRRHQRHEPVFAQRAQRQFGHRRRHHAGATIPAVRSAGIAFQRHWESRAFVAGGGNYNAPAQRVGDFLRGRASTQLGAVSCRPTRPASRLTDLSTCLPDFAVEAMREALPVFGRQIPGFDHGRRGADRRGDAHLVADAHHARRRLPEPQHERAVSRRARARAMPAASCRRRWTASRSPRRWRCTCWANRPIDRTPRLQQGRTKQVVSTRPGDWQCPDPDSGIFCQSRVIIARQDSELVIACAKQRILPGTRQRRVAHQHVATLRARQPCAQIVQIMSFRHGETAYPQKVKVLTVTASPRQAA